MKVLVFGGNGLLGKAICNAGRELKGWHMGAISRNSNGPLRGDILNPDSYRDILKDYDAVIDTVGILLENKTYKKSLSGDLSTFITNGIPSLFNPMNKSITYNDINRDSLIKLSNEVSNVGNSLNKDIPLVYISAHSCPPGIPKGYITSKREAEYYMIKLSNEKGGIRPIILRPGFMYDANDESNTRKMLKTVIGSASMFLNWVPPPVSTQSIAIKCINAIDDNRYRGIIV
ncbi:ubiquinone biosynthesis protein [Pichia kluyveri]|uniref:Ubiquinone biosynthesis protein n=1 Tax=Pichia kluyveri TaxID=36015 RepID=A0AAV5R4D7_PICKL|nr:ubiquinone biosynthesis protein [Pichia kluyveri]